MLSHHIVQQLTNDLTPRLVYQDITLPLSKMCTEPPCILRLLAVKHSNRVAKRTCMRLRRRGLHRLTIIA
jgi:hypothetical protein